MTIHEVQMHLYRTLAIPLSIVLQKDDYIECYMLVKTGNAETVWHVNVGKRETCRNPDAMRSRRGEKLVSSLDD